MIGIGLGLGLGVSGGSQGGAPAPEPNPNLLLWSEEFQQATWTKSSATITADAGDAPLGGSVADRVALTGLGNVSQVSGVAATTGAGAFASANLSTAWQRFSVSGTFDDAVYVFSVYLREEAVAGLEVQLRLERSGGFLACRLRDLGDEPTFLAWGAKLETPDLTTYVKREGT